VHLVKSKRSQIAVIFPDQMILQKFKWYHWCSSLPQCKVSVIQGNRFLTNPGQVWLLLCMLAVSIHLNTS